MSMEQHRGQKAEPLCSERAAQLPAERILNTRAIRYDLDLLINHLPGKPLNRHVYP
jgi:hypothetical protein